MYVIHLNDSPLSGQTASDNFCCKFFYTEFFSHPLIVNARASCLLTGGSIK